MPRLIVATLLALPAAALALTQVPMAPLVPETDSEPKNEHNLSRSDNGGTCCSPAQRPTFAA